MELNLPQLKKLELVSHALELTELPRLVLPGLTHFASQYLLPHSFLPAMLKMPLLEHVDIDSSEVEDNGLDFAAGADARLVKAMKKGGWPKMSTFIFPVVSAAFLTAAQNWKQLEELSVRVPPNAHPNRVVSLLRAVPTLRYLELVRWPDELVDAVAPAADSKFALSESPPIRHELAKLVLEFGTDAVFRAMSFAALSKLALRGMQLDELGIVLSSCPALRWLQLSDCKVRFDERTAGKHGKLEQFVIADASQISADHVAALVVSCPALVHLKVTAAQPRGLLLAALIARAPPQLQRLEISNAFGFEPEQHPLDTSTLLRLLRRLPALQFVRLAGQSLPERSVKATLLRFRQTVPKSQRPLPQIYLQSQRVEYTDEQFSTDAYLASVGQEPHWMRLH